MKINHKSSGFTLIELMIAVTISMFVILGALQIFITNRASYHLIDGMAKLQENGRFSLELVSRSIRMAGYPTDIFTGTRIAGTDGSNGTDTITVNFIEDVASTDCAGNAVTAGGVSTNTYSISSGQLICNGSTTTEMVVIGGAEKIEILYGEDTDATPDALPNRYVTATELNDNPDPDPAVTAALTAARWNRISTVRIHLLLNSITPALGQPQTYLYQGASNTSSDLLLRQEYVTTVTLRSRSL